MTLCGEEVQGVKGSKNVKGLECGEEEDAEIRGDYKGVLVSDYLMYGETYEGEVYNLQRMMRERD